MAEGKKALSDLELGIRELFRIVVPGAYGVILILFLSPSSELAQFIGKSLGVGVGSSFFLGLLGYAVRPHERWAPYFLTFEKHRVQLNNEIARIIASNPAIPEVDAALVPVAHQPPDHVALYKVFLECKAIDIKDRIHYFSSFYYMLIELSFFSWFAAFCVTGNDLFELAGGSGHRSAVLAAAALIATGAFIEIALLYGLEAMKSVRSRLLMAASLLLPAVALFLLFAVSLKRTLYNISNSGWAPDVIPTILILVAFSFERLGAKQWKSIIREQIVLVNAQAIDLREMSKKWPY